jgi:hypothetical protein
MLRTGSTTKIAGAWQRRGGIKFEPDSRIKSHVDEVTLPSWNFADAGTFPVRRFENCRQGLFPHDLKQEKVKCASRRLLR